MNVVLGGAWSDQRCSEAFGVDASCSLCDPAGILKHENHDCSACQAVSLASLNLALSRPALPLIGPMPPNCDFDVDLGSTVWMDGSGQFSSDPALLSCALVWPSTWLGEDGPSLVGPPIGLQDSASCCHSCARAASGDRPHCF